MFTLHSGQIGTIHAQHSAIVSIQFTLHSGQIGTFFRMAPRSGLRKFTLHSGQIGTAMKSGRPMRVYSVHTPLRSDRDPHRAGHSTNW